MVMLMIPQWALWVWAAVATPLCQSTLQENLKTVFASLFQDGFGNSMLSPSVWWCGAEWGGTQRIPVGQQWSLLSKVLPKGWPWQFDRWVLWIVCVSWTLLGLCALVPHQGAQQYYTNDLWWSNHNLAFSYGCTLCIDFQEKKSIYFSLFSTSVLKEGY